MLAGGIEIDDGIRGDSVGNNDGLAQCGETIELYVALESYTDEPLKDVAARLTFDDPHLTLLHNDTSPYPKIKPSGKRTNENDWDIAISEDFGASEIVRMVLIVDAAGETMEFPFGLEVSCAQFEPEISRSIVDDGPTGDSVGNNDGIAQCGETIELSLRLSNFGDRPIRNISTTLIAVDPALTLLHNSDAGYADLDGNSGAWNDNDWDLQIGNVPDGYEARYQVLVRFDDGREERHRRSLPITCADPDPVSVASVTIDDGVFGDSIGNNNKIAQCGELIELYIELQNLTDGDLDGFEAVLSSDDPALRLLYNSSSPYAAMSPAASGENLNDWDLQVDAGIGDRYTAVVTLTIDALDLSIDVPVRLRCEA